jgi:hypothetical protein
VGSYRLSADGFVHLYGWAQPNIGFTATANVANIFASGLPAAITPSGIRDSIIACSVTGFARIYVNTSGNIYLVMPTTQAFSTSDWISLDGVSYKL